MERKYKMLIVDDEKSNLKKLKRTFRDNFEIFEALSGVEGFEIIKKNKIDIIIADQKMPDMTGIELLKRSIKINPDIVRIVLTGYTDVEDLIDAINEGRVHRYVTKPWNPDELKVIVNQAIERMELIKENNLLNEKLRILNEKLKEENFLLKREVKEFFNDSKIVFKSDEMKRVLEIASSIVNVDTTILITGETGTGKELLARYIHKNSFRKDNLFIPVNCGAIPSELIESELFGYKKGAFSGAVNDKKGLFQLSDGGTIFLDEIGEAPLNFQVKLLRVLQDREIWPVGSENGISVDVRVIAATNRDLKELVEKGKFREDLWYRLNVFNIHIPPLKGRKDDIEALFIYFLRKISKKFNKNIIQVEDDVIDIFKNYSWPGNVRQLQNEIERLVLLTHDGGKITKSMISPEIVKGKKNIDRKEIFIDMPLKKKMAQFEKGIIKSTLNNCNGNRSKAARILGITRQSLLQKMKKYGIS